MALMAHYRPKALIVGAQKAATEALMRSLAPAEGVWPCDQELHYFTTNYDKGDEWYLRQLRARHETTCGIGSAPPDLVIEKSPNYLSHELAPWRIHSFDPGMRIIVSLRNPIDRAFSRFNDIQVDEPDRYAGKTFDDILNLVISKEKHFVRLGCYAVQLVPFFYLFGRDNVLVIIQERLKANPEVEFQRVFDFLGIPGAAPELRTVHKNPYKSELSDRARTALAGYFKPHNEILFKLLDDPIPEWSQG